MKSPSSLANEAWIGQTSISIVPPSDYWARLDSEFSADQIERLRHLSDQRLNEFTPSALPSPTRTAIELLDRVVDDGWLEREQRQTCPNCEFEISGDQAAQIACPECNEAYSQHGDVVTEIVYVRNLAPSRVVDWMVAIHGMNTTGSWQEAFSWHLGTTWGRSVPVAVYKYGIVTAGGIMRWRRRMLLKELRDNLVALRGQALAHGFSGKPDFIAHSFGTWLLGHLLLNELEREPEERLKFGRIILTGCVLRPDFDWKRIKEAELVEDVLNHYGSKDWVVLLAHAAMWDSGPSGRRGFDGYQVINILAEGYGHSDLLSTKKYVVNGKHFQKSNGSTDEKHHLEHTYKRTWRPFLTLPRHELSRIPDHSDPTTRWRQLPWALRGTLFPFVVLPLILALPLLLFAAIGRGLWEVWATFAIISAIGGAGLGLLLVCTAVTMLWRRLFN